MDVILMGNGPFAVPLLDAIHQSQHPIRLVVTRPDRPQGKKLDIQPGPVTVRARALGLPVEQPMSVNDPATIDRLTSLGADILVVADFGQILSPRALAIARQGVINVHGSLLPKYRGAAPIPWAIHAGETKTGVTVIHMTSALDAGGMIGRRSLTVGLDETAGELEARLAPLGADLAVEILDQLQRGPLPAIEQRADDVTLAPRLTKEVGNIDWSRSAPSIKNHVRSMIPWPVAYTHWQRADGPPVRLQILAGQPEDRVTVHPPGTVIEASGNRLVIATGTGSFAIGRLRPAGKNEMDPATFLRGNRVQIGDQLQ